MDDLTDEALFQHGIFELATGLRNQCDGSSDPWQPEEVEAVMRYLARRIVHWREPSSQVDEAARAYVAGCVVEAMTAHAGHYVPRVDEYLVSAITHAHNGHPDDAARMIRDALRMLGLDSAYRVRLWVQP